MKKSLSILLFSLCLCAPVSAAPVITVDEAGHCFIDGVNSGLAGDCIVNHPQHAAAVNIALKAQHAKVQADAAASIAKAQTDAAAQVKAAQDAQAAAEAAATAAKAAADKEFARAAAVIAALRNAKFSEPLPPEVVAAMATEDQKAKAALMAQRAELEAKLAAFK